MNKLKEKMALVYLAFNILAALAIAVAANLITIASYYQIGYFRALQRLLFNNFYTLAYLLLLWLLNYVVMEAFVEIFDNLVAQKYRYIKFKDRQVVSLAIAVTVLAIIVLLILHPLDLYFYNFIGVAIYLALRKGYQEIKEKGLVKFG